MKGKGKAAKQLVFGIKSFEIWSNKAESYKKIENLFEANIICEQKWPVKQILLYFRLRIIIINN